MERMVEGPRKRGDAGWGEGKPTNRGFYHCLKKETQEEWREEADIWRVGGCGVFQVGQPPGP